MLEHGTCMAIEDSVVQGRHLNKQGVLCDTKGPAYPFTIQMMREFG